MLQLLNPNHWPRLDEAARLRTENRLIRNLQDGRYLRESYKRVAGALATWSGSFWTHFSLKREAMQTLVEKLRSSSAESQDYVLRFCFGWLGSLAEKPPFTLQSVLAERLTAGDIRFKEALDSSLLWEDEHWDERVRKARESFQSAEPAFDDGDIPF